MGYITRFKPPAQREFLKVPKVEALRILHRLTEFQRALDKGDTSAFDVKAMRGHHARWRLRVGDHRVVYTIDHGVLVVWVVSVGQRREIYRRF